METRRTALAGAERARVPAIGRVAVIGAGTMGSRIAALFANAGVPSCLLDVDERLAAEGLARARAARPSPFFVPEAADLVTPGSLNARAGVLGEADWIVEAVVERLDVKQQLLRHLEGLRRPGSIISSNTSGLSIASIAGGAGIELRQHFLGTHFFNPPRFVPLLEIVPAPDTDPSVVDAVCRFADYRLGRGVVIARDTPGFIGNRIALFDAVRMIEQVESGDYTIEEVDALFGPFAGRAKSATFRTLDIAGLDVVAAVLRDLHARLPAPERDRFTVPALLDALVARGRLGEKTGAGFYRRVRGPGGTSTILVLDPKTFEYRPRIEPAFPDVDALRDTQPPARRLRALRDDPGRAGTLLRRTLLPTLGYVAAVHDEMAFSTDDVDRAMRWGFGWEAGPFELIDALGDRTSRVLPPAGRGMELLRVRAASHPIMRTPGASLVDIGRGVLCVALHSKMNALGFDAFDVLDRGIDEAERHGTALVIGTESLNFSAGANVHLLLRELEGNRWDAVDALVQRFQQMTRRIRYARVPVVAAITGLTLGGGCEIALHASRVQAAAETYIGLVETGIGLVPAGGGLKEMLRRAAMDTPGPAGLMAAVQRVFEIVGFGRVSSSAPDARRLGYLSATDRITINRLRLIADARDTALSLARSGYQPPVEQAIPVGGQSVGAALDLGVHLAHRAGRITDHEACVGRTLARVLAGGDLPHATHVSEQYLLDLEREAFLRLCGEPRTRERIRSVGSR